MSADNKTQCIEELIDFFYSEDKPDDETKTTIVEGLTPILDKYFTAMALPAVDPKILASVLKKSATKKDGSDKKTPGPKKGSVNRFNIFLQEQCDWEEFKKNAKEENSEAVVRYADFQKAMDNQWKKAKDNSELMKQMQERGEQFNDWKVDHPKGRYADFKKDVGPMNA